MRRSEIRGVKATTRFTRLCLAAVTIALAAGLALVPTTVASAAPTGCQPGFFYVVSNTLTSRAPDGTVTAIAPTGGVYETLAFNPSDGFLYGIGRTAGVAPNIYRIQSDGTTNDLGVPTGLPAPIGGTNYYASGAFEDAGGLWILQSAAGTVTTAYRIDIFAMTATSLALAPAATWSGDVAYFNGALYGTQASFSTSGPVRRLDLTTGAVTNSSPVIGLSTQATSFWSTADGHLYASQSTGSIVELVNFTTATPTAVTVASGIGTLNDGAYCRAAENPFLNAFYDDFTATPVTNTQTAIAGNVFQSDTLNGATFIPADVTVTLVSDGGLTGVTVGSDGAITVPAGAPLGTFVLTYRICETATPTICDTATSAVLVQAPPPTTTTPPTTTSPGGPPPTSPPPAPTPVAGPGTETAPTLAVTGSDHTGPAITGAMLILLGAVLLWLGRRSTRRVAQ